MQAYKTLKTFYYHSFYFSCRFAYIEFADKESVRTAMALDESLFRGRQIKVRNPQITALKWSSDDPFYNWTSEFISVKQEKLVSGTTKRVMCFLFNEEGTSL